MYGSKIKLLLPFLLLLALSQSTATAADWKFTASFTKDVNAKPFSGRVYLIFTKSNREPRLGPSWFRPELFLSRDVENVKPGDTVEFNSTNTDSMLAFPKPLAEMELNGYQAQVVFRFNPWDRNIGTGSGNGYSAAVVLNKSTHNVSFEVNKLVPARSFKDTQFSKLLKIRSELLSKFHGKDVFLQAAVILPASYKKSPNRRYPTIFSIPGFGGNHFSGRTEKPVNEQNKSGVEFLRVVLDPSCPLGHHVFADSANNGPVGQALTEELIPEFDKQYRSIAKPTARFLTGHSSGGWSSLWLQVTYPDFFGGTWSTAPDPVDFRDFQRINLYNPGENMYRDADGKRRPLARQRGNVLLWYQDFAEMEWTLGPGGQLHSFEAVFSDKGPDGKPLLVWDRKTGKVNTAVAKTWEKYDIRLILERNWIQLGPKLAGKLHVFMGDQDTFYLEGATILLKQSLKNLDGDAVVEIHPGKDHSTLTRVGNLRQRIRSEMVDAFLKHHADEIQ